MVITPFKVSRKTLTWLDGTSNTSAAGDQQADTVIDLQ